MSRYSQGDPKKLEEGIDYEWRDVEGSGGTAKSRHFFTRREKAAQEESPTRKALGKAKKKTYSGRGSDAQWNDRRSAWDDSPNPDRLYSGRGEGFELENRRSADDMPSLMDRPKKAKVSFDETKRSSRLERRAAKAAPAKEILRSPGQAFLPPFEEWKAMSRRERRELGLPESVLGYQNFYWMNWGN